MNKKLRNLIILAAVAVVVIVAFVLLPKLEPKENADAAVTAQPTVDPALLTFAEYSADQIKTLKLEYDGVTTVLKYDTDGETIIVEGHEDIAIDQTTARNVLYTSAKVVVEQILTEDMSDLAQFGLEDPVITATAEYTDGTSKTFYYGNKVPGSSQYYMMIEGIDKVLIVWNNYGSNAKKSLNDLVAVETQQMAIEDLRDISIYKDDQILMSFTNIGGEQKLIDMGSWKLSQPYYRSLDATSETSKWNELSNQLLELFSIDDVLDSVGSPAEYGLDSPWIVVEFVKQSGETISLEFAKENEDGICAMKFSDSDIIYQTKPSKLSFADTEPFDLVEKLLMLINVKYVSEIDMSGIVGDYTLEITHTEAFDEDGNVKLDGAGEPVVNTGYVVEGVELTDDEKDQGSWFYQAILITKLFREADDDFVAGEPIGSIKLTLTEEPNEYTVEFYEYDDYFYAVKTPGSDVYFVAEKDDVIKIKDTYEDLIAREVEKPY